MPSTPPPSSEIRSGYTSAAPMTMYRGTLWPVFFAMLQPSRIGRKKKNESAMPKMMV